MCTIAMLTTEDISKRVDDSVGIRVFLSCAPIQLSSCTYSVAAQYRKETLLYEVLMPGVTVSLVHVVVAQQPGSSAFEMKRQTSTLLEETDVMLKRTAVRSP
jgi:hypothetical protein